MERLLDYIISFLLIENGFRAECCFSQRVHVSGQFYYIAFSKFGIRMSSIMNQIQNHSINYHNGFYHHHHDIQYLNRVYSKSMVLCLLIKHI